MVKTEAAAEAAAPFSFFINGGFLYFARPISAKENLRKIFRNFCVRRGEGRRHGGAARPAQPRGPARALAATNAKIERRAEQASERLGVRTSEHPDVRASERPDVRASGRSGVRTSERPSFRASERRKWGRKVLKRTIKYE